MALRKFNKVESTEVLTPEQHQGVNDQLKRFGKAAVSELTDEELETLSLDESNFED